MTAEAGTAEPLANAVCVRIPVHVFPDTLAGIPT